MLLVSSRAVFFWLSFITDLSKRPACLLRTKRHQEKKVLYVLRLGFSLGGAGWEVEGRPPGHQQGNQSLGTAGGVHFSPHQDIFPLFLLFFLLFLGLPSPPLFPPPQWEAEKWTPLPRPPLEGMQITKGSPKHTHPRPSQWGGGLEGGGAAT